MTNAPTIFLCPYCQGQKIVSKPPNVPGGLRERSASSSVNSYPCLTCEGRGYVVVREEGQSDGLTKELGYPR